MDHSLTDLEKPNEITENKAVDVGKLVHHGDGRLRVGVIDDAVLVEVGGYERFVQLSVPQLEQGGRHMGVGAVRWGNPLVTANLQRIHLINITGHSEMGKVSEWYKKSLF